MSLCSILVDCCLLFIVTAAVVVCLICCHCDRSDDDGGGAPSKHDGRLVFDKQMTDELVCFASPTKCALNCPPMPSGIHNIVRRCLVNAQYCSNVNAVIPHTLALRHTHSLTHISRLPAGCC
jgi:hypothetical protein